MVKKIKYGNTQALKDYMLEGKRVSRIESLILFGVQNFTAVLTTFKRNGFIIKKEKVTMAKIMLRLNKSIKCNSPKNLPIKEIIMNEWWISR